MDRNNIKEKAEEVEKIYNEFLQKMQELKKEQNMILDEFMAELEKAKMEDIRNKLNN